MQLLIDVGANLEAHDCHFGTPLHVACAREHLDCVKLLLKAGTEPRGLLLGGQEMVSVSSVSPHCSAAAFLSKGLSIYSFMVQYR